jgi:pimeloyl-ACP methyl ester carboxylesterase
MPAHKISTIVRFALTRAFFAVGARVAPRFAIEHGFRLYGTTARKRETPAPQAPGLEAVPFAIDAPVAARRLAAWRWAPPGSHGREPVILLVHGWGGHAAQMKGFVAPLVAAGFRVVAFDQPAHGASAGNRSHMLEFRAAVLAVANHPEVRGAGEVVAVIGHSLGATATMLALERGLTARRVVLIAPPIDPGEFVDMFAGAMGLPAHLAEGVKQRVRSFLREDLGNVDTPALAQRMTAAALVVHDSTDRTVPPEQGRTLAASWPGALFETVSGLGHNKILRDPAVIARACEFVAPGPASVGEAAVNRLRPR